MADLEVWNGEPQGASLPGMLTCVLDPVGRLGLTSKEPGQGVSKSGSLPDSRFLAALATSSFFTHLPFGFLAPLLSSVLLFILARTTSSPPCIQKPQLKALLDPNEYTQSQCLFFPGLLVLLPLAISGHLGPFLVFDLSCVDKTEFHTLRNES